MAEGKIKIPISQVFTFEKVPEAYDSLMNRKATGKIVVEVAI